MFIDFDPATRSFIWGQNADFAGFPDPGRELRGLEGGWGWGGKKLDGPHTPDHRRQPHPIYTNFFHPGQPHPIYTNFFHLGQPHPIYTNFFQKPFFNFFQMFRAAFSAPSAVILSKSINPQGPYVNILILPFRR